jgi:hypothetical protein
MQSLKIIMPVETSAVREAEDERRNGRNRFGGQEIERSTPRNLFLHVQQRVSFREDFFRALRL